KPGEKVAFKHFFNFMPVNSFHKERKEVFCHIPRKKPFHIYAEFLPFGTYEVCKKCSPNCRSFGVPFSIFSENMQGIGWSKTNSLYKPFLDKGVHYFLSRQNIFIPVNIFERKRLVFYKGKKFFFFASQVNGLLFCSYKKLC